MNQAELCREQVSFYKTFKEQIVPVLYIQTVPESK